MLALIEVQVPTGIGAQFVITRIEGVAQHKLSTSITLWCHDDILALHQQAIRRQQFDIENAAHVGGLQVVGTDDIGFIPKGIAYEIACIVGMNIDFLLHLCDGRPFQSLFEVIQGTSAAREGSKKEEYQ